MDNEFLSINKEFSYKQKIEISKESFPYFSSEFIQLEEDRFSFENHPYLFEIYSEHHPNVVIEKGSQVGATTFALLKALWACKFIFSKGAIYFFPTKTDVIDFTRGRVNPILSKNNIFREGLRDTDTDSVGMKKIGKSFIYFRGMESKIQAKSVPADLVVFDELDEIKPSSRKLAEDRIDHSKFKWVIELSIPSIPGYGIDSSFRNSDQRFYMFCCPHCNKWHNLEEEFPNCLREDEKGDVKRICLDCGGEISLKDKTEWVPKHPSRKNLRGYHLSQLFSPRISPKKLLKEFRSTDHLDIFYNSKIGLPYVIGSEQLDFSILKDNCSIEPEEINSNVNNFLGVDQGKVLYVVIGRQENNRARIVALKEFKDFEQLDKLMLDYKITLGVVDALPETRKAKEFAKRHPFKIFLNFYNSNLKGEIKWHSKEKIVEADRTFSLDVSGEELLNTVFPRYNTKIGTFLNHCKSLLKKLKIDEKTGSKRYTYLNTGADHYRHAFNYFVLAKNKMKDKGVPRFIAGEDDEEKAEKKFARDII